MTALSPTGMTPAGLFTIAQPGDTLNNLAIVASTGSYNDLINQPNIPSGQVQSNWTESNASALDYISNKPALATVAVSGSYNDLINQPSIPSAQIQSDWSEANTGLADYIKNKPTIPSVARTTSTLSLSLVGTGATGTQISATNNSSISCCASTSTTSTIGGPSTSAVVLKICSTNNVTEGSWTTVATLENDQTITLAIALNSIQVLKGQLCADVPTGWFVKLVNNGSGTHSEAFLSGQQTVYG